MFIEMPKKLGSVSVLIVFSVCLLYIQQMMPSPLLNSIENYYHIYQNDALLNLSVSIIFPSIIVASLYGGTLEIRLGTSALFSLAIFLSTLGLACHLIAGNYYIFLAGRLLFGAGFGLGIPFMGSAIMKWYSGKQRDFMSAVNGMFPFIGTMISFGVSRPLYVIMNGSLRLTLSVWAVPLAVALLTWKLLYLNKKTVQIRTDLVVEKRTKVKGLYRQLIKRKNIRMLCAAFICDFLCYSYLAIILPTYLYEIGGVSESAAGLLAAFAFPAAGIAGVCVGYLMINKTGLRKPALAIGQLVKLLGGATAALGNTVSPAIVVCGVAFFGIGNALWMPAMYIVPTELDEMDSSKVAASFSLISSCGFAVGFVGPVIGGFITNRLMLLSDINDAAQSHVFGLSRSLLIFSFVNLIAFFCILRMTETGAKKEHNKNSAQSGI